METNLELSTVQEKDASIISLNDSVSPFKLVHTHSNSSAKETTDGSPIKVRGKENSQGALNGLRDNHEFMSIFKKAEYVFSLTLVFESMNKAKRNMKSKLH